MARVDTLPLYLRPLMDGATVRACRCVVCGASAPLNQHHVVRRSAGKLYRHGMEVPKPTLTLCGSGNASGCHGLAHAQMLHLRWVTSDEPIGTVQWQGSVTTKGGHWEYLRTAEPVKEFTAQQIADGWRPVRK